MNSWIDLPFCDLDGHELLLVLKDALARASSIDSTAALNAAAGVAAAGLVAGAVEDQHLLRPGVEALPHNRLDHRGWVLAACSGVRSQPMFGFTTTRSSFLTNVADAAQRLQDLLHQGLIVLPLGDGQQRLAPSGFSSAARMARTSKTGVASPTPADHAATRSKNSLRSIRNLPVFAVMFAGNRRPISIFAAIGRRCQQTAAGFGGAPGLECARWPPRWEVRKIRLRRDRRCHAG